MSYMSGLGSLWADRNTDNHRKRHRSVRHRALLVIAREVEAGIARTLNKDVILLAQDIDDVPFDLRPLSVLLYRPTPRGLQQLTIDLKRRIDEVTRGHRRA